MKTIPMQLKVDEQTFNHIKCSVCGSKTDRDHNAAINILSRAGTARINASGDIVRPSLDSENQNLAVSLNEESPPNQALA